ncbi:DNA polymerase I [Lachnospiraceae bacterium 54-53]
MDRKKLLLIDGSSMLKEAFYGLPSRGAYGVRNLIRKILESGQADYIAAGFSGEEENSLGDVSGNKNVREDYLKQREALLEMLASMNIPVFNKKGYGSSDIIASLAGQRGKEDVDVVILTADRRLLQAVGDHVTVRMPGLGESGLEFQDYSADSLRERYGLEPKDLKEILPLSGERGIGEKTASRLIGQYGTIENLYLHINEVGSLRLREALSACRETVWQEKESVVLREDCDIRLDYGKALAEGLSGGVLAPEAAQEAAEEGGEAPSHESEFRVVSDFGEAEAIFSKCREISRLGLQLVVEDREVSALGLCLGEKECFCFIPQGFLTPDYLAGKAEEICKTSEHVTVLHLKSQLAFLKLGPESQVFDGGVAAYLLNPMKDSYEYHDLAEDYLDLSIPSKAALLGKGTMKRGLEENREKAVSCVCHMAYVAWKCGDKLREDLRKTGMEKLFYEIEMPLIYSLFHMEEAGIQVERERLKEYGDRLKVRIAQEEEKIYRETGETFNINSPKQLGEVLFDHMKLPGGKKTKTGYSTAADVLEKLAPDHPVVGMILDYRQFTKLNSTYADGLAAYIGPDERIHGTFNQTITATGRISSTEPNLQNIPVRMELGREIRKVFVPGEGCVFVDADYSQIELRVLAHMSGDPRLINAYRQAEDIHAITASEVFHVPLHEVTPLQRRNAKAVNFGIVYGISSFGLSEGLSITRKEASEYINKYFETYPGVKAFLDRLVAEAKEQGYAVSMFGRRRPVPELKSSNFMQRSFGERVAMNSPIQGTAADIIKIAMIRVDRALRSQGLKSTIVLQVHDELLIEARREELDRVKELLVEEMKHAADLEVPLEVEANVGGSWFDAK